jgi:hypothetical protein
MAASSLDDAAVAAPSLDVRLREIRVEQAQQRDMLAAILRLLERSHGPRDQADRALVSLIATISRGLRFTAAALWRRRVAGDVALAEALDGADIVNAKQLGKLLRRCEGADVNGVRLRRVGTNREGAVWQQE